MRLTKMYIAHGGIPGPMWVDADQFAYRTRLTIYTSRGNRAFEKAKTKAEAERLSWGVHRDNLFHTPAEAASNYERIMADMALRTLP